MAERTTGVHAIFSPHWAYSAFQIAVGARNVRRFVVNTLLELPATPIRLLDIGCGPGDILEDLPANVEYTGCDLSAEYISAAKRRFPTRGKFFLAAAEALTLSERFDRILALGLLHHLDDDQVRSLMRTARNALAPGGMLVTFDGVYRPKQSLAAKTILGMDRGKHIRWEGEYRTLATTAFDDVTTTVRTDLLRMPYAHIFMQCRATS